MFREYKPTPPTSDLSNITVEYDEANEVFNFHIPGSGTVKKVSGLGKDEVKKIFNEMFPESLRKDLGGALKDVEKEVVQQVVGKVILPVMEEVLKPLEKLMFTRGSHALQIAYQETNKLLDNVYEPPKDLIDRAIQYANREDNPKDTSWGKWLGEMDVPDWPKDPDVNKTTYNYWQWQVEQWDGWKPFVVALHKYQHSDGYTRDQIIADFNAINFYVANSGNLSIGLYFKDMYDRVPDVVATLNKYKDTGVPLKRGDIEHFITELGPYAIDITGSAKIDLGIQIGGSVGLWGVPTHLCLFFLDEVLKYAGVPQ